MTDDTKKGEIVPVSEGENLLASVDDSDVDRAIAAIGKRSDMMRRITAAIVKRTYANDWTDFKGKPWLGDAGSERVLSLIGATVTITPPGLILEDHEDDRGRYYIYRVYGTVTVPGIGARDISGSCSSRKQFFAEKTRKDADGKPVYENGEKVKDFIPYEEIDRVYIQNDALSDLYRNAAVRAVGLRGLTWKELEAHGIKKGEGGSIQFDGKDAERAAAQGQRQAPPQGRQSAPSQAPAPKSPPQSAPAPAPQEAPRSAPAPQSQTGSKGSPAEVRSTYQGMLDAYFGDDEDAKGDFVYQASGFEGSNGWVEGRRSLQELSDKWVMGRGFQSTFEQNYDALP